MSERKATAVDVKHEIFTRGSGWRWDDDMLEQIEAALADDPGGTRQEVAYRIADKVLGTEDEPPEADEAPANDLEE